jgi:hypothetical protein
MKNRCLKDQFVRFAEIEGKYTRCGQWAGKSKRTGSNGLNGPSERAANLNEERTMTKKYGKISAAKRAEAQNAGGLAGTFDDGFDDGEIGEQGLGASMASHPVFGALGGGALAGTGLLVAKGMRKTHPRVAKYAGVVALAVGGIPSLGLVLFSRKYRGAGYLGLAMTALVGGIELVRVMFVEPELGLYQAEMTGAGIEILDAQADAIAEAMVAGALGQPGVQILGQTTAAQAMGLGMYQTESVQGAHPIEVMGVTPYTGHFG